MEWCQPGEHVTCPPEYPPSRSPGAPGHALHVPTIGWCRTGERTGSPCRGLDQVLKPCALPSWEGATLSPRMPPPADGFAPVVGRRPLEQHRSHRPQGVRSGRLAPVLALPLLGSTTPRPVHLYDGLAGSRGPSWGAATELSTRPVPREPPRRGWCLPRAGGGGRPQGPPQVRRRKAQGQMSLDTSHPPRGQALTTRRCSPVPPRAVGPGTPSSRPRPRRSPARAAPTPTSARFRWPQPATGAGEEPGALGLGRPPGSWGS